MTHCRLTGTAVVQNFIIIGKHVSAIVNNTIGSYEITDEYIFCLSLLDR